MKRSKDNTVIPRRPLLWLAAAFLFLVPTMLGHLATWVPVVFLVALLAKFWMEKKDRRLRSLVWKIVFALAGLGAVVTSYGSPTGVEPGVSLLVLLAAMKILEAHTARDFHVLVMMGWILCLCSFVMSQDFIVAICVLAAFILLLAALVQFHRRRATGGAFWLPLGAAARILFQAFPLVVIFFILFPRGMGAIRLRLPGVIDSVGFNGKLSPGTVASIASSDEIAFRAEFPDGKIPSPATLYWRGAVLLKGAGLEWGGSEGLGKARAVSRLTSGTVLQRITLEPQAGNWLFALDRPLLAPPGSILAPGLQLRTPRPLNRIRRYDVVSAADASEEDLRPRERTTCLSLPASITPEVRQLARSWATPNNDPRAVVKAALQYFRTQGFVYSVSPGAYQGEDALDEFLFRRRVGFCEHYAGAFATLMRAAGIPSRVVVGFLGGQFNQFGHYLLVRQSDAHAWCEVWLDGTGWERVDPTSVIAPARVNLGSLREMEAAAQNNTLAGDSSTAAATGMRGVFDDARLAWDTISFAWDTRVLSFDLDAQSELLTQWRMDDWGASFYSLGVAALVALLLAGYAILIRLAARPRRDPLRALYDQFCRKAARLGAARLASEGPADFAARAAEKLPDKAGAIERITDGYIALRYAPAPVAARLRELAAEVRGFGRA